MRTNGWNCSFVLGIVPRLIKCPDNRKKITEILYSYKNLLCVYVQNTHICTHTHKIYLWLNRTIHLNFKLVVKTK